MTARSGGEHRHQFRDHHDLAGVRAANRHCGTSRRSVGLVSQNFLAGAAGLAVGIAFIRGFARERSATIGNFWVDLVRALLWVLLPLSLVGGLLLVWQGVPPISLPTSSAHAFEGGTQVIAQGPIAALEFIKNLGTNGGGFFNVNGAHPYKNPTPLVNLLALLAIAVLPASLPITFGRIGRPASQPAGCSGDHGRAVRRGSRWSATSPSSRRHRAWPS